MIKPTQKTQIVCLAIIGCLLLACDKDRGLRDVPILNGRVGGDAWQFKSGKAFRNPVNRSFELTFYSQSEPSGDACAIATTGNSHLKMTVPARTGNLNLPVGGRSLSFEQAGNAGAFQAASGFIEITEIAGLHVSGFLQATFDEDNTVEGRFRLKICN